MSDITALGRVTFVEFLVVLDNYLQKVERVSKEYAKFVTKDDKRKPV